jgi:hypothetical protein
MTEKSRKTANLTGIVLGIVFAAGLVFLNLPSRAAQPEPGVAIQISAKPGFLITPSPLYPDPILETASLKTDQATSGSLNLVSNRSETETVELVFETNLNNQILNQALWLSIDGEINSLEDLQETPYKIELKPGVDQKIEFKAILAETDQPLPAELAQIEIIPTPVSLKEAKP